MFQKDAVCLAYRFSNSWQTEMYFWGYVNIHIREAESNFFPNHRFVLCKPLVYAHGLPFSLWDSCAGI